ncbi:MAG: PGPGW domain-containing protein [Candidatus Binatia bacterium]
MLERLKRRWRHFKAGTPGRRFQQQYDRRRESGRSPVKKVLFIGLGTLLMVAGVFFLFVPGPGLLVLVLGAALIAQQSLLAARTLDSIEIRVRKLLNWILGAWRSFSPALKILVAVLALVVVGAVGFGAFKLLIA